MFCWKASKRAPYINKLKRFSELFCFREDIRLQSSKFACQISQRLRGEHILVEKENIHEPVFVCLYGARFYLKKSRKSPDTVPISVAQCCLEKGIRKSSQNRLMMYSMEIDLSKQFRKVNLVTLHIAR